MDSTTNVVDIVNTDKAMEGEMISGKKVKAWIDQNLLLNLDQLTGADAKGLLDLAENETWTFLRLGEYAFRLRRRRVNLPAQASKREVAAFLLELRVKLQLVSDGISGVPAVPLFDFGGEVLFRSTAFKHARLLYSPGVGRA